VKKQRFCRWWMAVLSGVVVIGGVAAGVLFGLGIIGSKGISFPKMTPPVKQVTPSGLIDNTTFTTTDFQGSDVQSRFFTKGPTNIFQILHDIDSRIQGYVSGSTQGKHDCLSSAGVNYQIQFAGQTVDMYAQCYDIIPASYPLTQEGLVQFGQINDTFYIYQNVGDSMSAGRAVALSGTNLSVIDDVNYIVDVWYSVGVLNQNNGTYGVAQIHADPSTPLFEMTAAGRGMGFCGAQYQTDGISLQINGSAGDIGSCELSTMITLNATNITQSVSQVDFIYLLTPLGLVGGDYNINVPASDYPGGINNNVIIYFQNQSDSVYFGPILTPTTGVSAW